MEHGLSGSGLRMVRTRDRGPMWTPDADYVRLDSGEIVNKDAHRGPLSGQFVARQGRPIPLEEARRLGLVSVPVHKAVLEAPETK